MVTDYIKALLRIINAILLHFSCFNFRDSTSYV